MALSELATNDTEAVRRPRAPWAEVRRAALQLLLKMTKNVAESPTEAKFRRIKMSSAVGS